MDPDLDPGGQKTCGSGGAGSGTLPGRRMYLRKKENSVSVPDLRRPKWSKKKKKKIHVMRS
jgi:hypothetical protein